MRLHVIDGTFELFRAHFSRRPGHVHAGRDLKATVGLADSLLALLHDAEEAVSHVAIAFDNPIRSVRNDWFAGYKTDEGVPAELLAQFDLAEDTARALGVVVWSMDRYEADDALATAAARWADRVAQVRLLTPDKDLGQALRGERVVMVDRVRRRVISEASLRERRSIGPASVPDWLALVGDAADGYPGLPGFGERTASSLLGRYGHLDEIPEDPATWPAEIRQPSRLAVTLRDQMPLAQLYRKLATLIDDVPLASAFDDLEWAGVPRGPFHAWCERVGARDIRERPLRWRPDGSSDGS
jgi:5'-3' exonuclease